MQVRIELVHGRTMTIALPLRNPDGTNYDLTGADVQWWIGDRPRLIGQPEPIVYLKKWLDNGITAVPGGVQIRIARGDADILPIGHLYHEMAISKGNDMVQPMSGALVCYGALVDLLPSVLIPPLVIGAPTLDAPTLVVNP